MQITHYAIPGLKRKYLKTFAPGVITPDKLEQIKQAVLIGTNLTHEDFVNKSRRSEYVQARQIFCHLAKKHTKAYLRQIAAFIGDKDHTTVIASLERMSDLMDTEEDLRELVRRIEDKF